MSWLSFHQHREPVSQQQTTCGAPEAPVWQCQLQPTAAGKRVHRPADQVGAMPQRQGRQAARRAAASKAGRHARRAGSKAGRQAVRRAAGACILPADLAAWMRSLNSVRRPTALNQYLEHSGMNWAILCHLVSIPDSMRCERPARQHGLVECQLQCKGSWQRSVACGWVGGSSGAAGRSGS